MSVELLAPAGSYEGVLECLDYGADAVYLGGSFFGARAYAKNLDLDQLKEVIDQAHIRNKKIYLTVNTLLKNRELYGTLYEYLAPLYNQGLDAAIVQDYGVMNFIEKEFPQLAIHASTQMTVTGPKGASLLEKQGVKRVVTARELSLDEIAAIRQECSLEIESFVHGALCYSYSGQCLFSSLLGGRSGNRGRCAQPCRLPYEAKLQGQVLTKGKNVCPLSPKDMCTIDILPKIIEAGVTSLKIEGRMKQSSYASGVLNIYRKYLDLYLEQKEKYHVQEEDRQELLALFNRGGFSRGYYEVRKGPGMMAFTNEKKVGESRRNLIKIKEKVKGNLILSVEKPAILELEYAGNHVKVQGEMVQEAKKQPLNPERICQQISKTGGTAYELVDLQMSVDESVFLPMASLNQLRREAFVALEESMKISYRRQATSNCTKSIFWENKAVDCPQIMASCDDLNQGRELLKFPEITGIYCPPQVAKKLLVDRTKNSPAIYLALPHMIRGNDLDTQKADILKAIENGAVGILARTLESVAWLMEQGLQERIVLDSNLYTFNQESILWWEKQGVKKNTAPLELNRQELAHRKNCDSELIVYGYLPMMISAQCLRENLSSCGKDNSIVTLTDRYRKNFSVKCYCNSCYNIIYNSIPYGLLKEAEEVKNLGFPRIRLSFTLECPEEVRKIAEAYIKCYNSKNENTSLPMELTKGHFKRGVE